ncbi:MAG: tail fiber domain-containing protein [Saprospiraceae bacterium]|nr:tail fiber domain-containing protein [Saprospiraceae bacterium]
MVRVIILLACVLGYATAGAQNVGIHTLSPQAPFHVYNGGQVNTPGGSFVLGNTFEAHLEMDFDRLQAKFNNSLLPMWIQPEGGNLNLSSGRIFIDYNNAEIGLGTASPDAPVHIYGNGELAVPGGLLVLGHTGLAHMELDFDRIQSNHGVSSNLTLKIQPDGGDLNIGNNAVFVDNDLNRVGIGTTATPARLHVRGSGFTSATVGLEVTNAFGQTSLYVDDGGNVGINGVTTPTSALEVGGSIELSGDVKSRNNNDTEMAFSLDGDDIGFRADGTELMFMDGSTSDIEMAANNNSRVGIGNVPSLDTKLEIYAQAGEHPFSISGVNAQFMVDTNGFTGIGTLQPASDLHIIHGDNNNVDGLTIENAEGADTWRFHATDMSGTLLLYRNDAIVGYFHSSGWDDLSDRRRKTDIQPLRRVLPSVNQMTPSTYFMTTDNDRKKRDIGFIAQDVQKFFPEAVSYSEEEDVYTMNYNMMSVIAIKAVQELSEQNTELKTRNAELEKRLLRLESLVEGLIGG